MAEIKCKYYRFKCYDGTYQHSGDICEHHNEPWDEYDSLCDYANDRPRECDGVIEIPMQCRYAIKDTVMFSRSAKWYELDKEGLRLPRTWIPFHRIVWLTIDGETVVGREGLTNGKTD